MEEKAKTAKIKVAVNTTQVNELEISFPYYTKNDGLYCKFFNRRAAMWISDLSFKKQIEYSDFGVPENWITFDPITEEEFNAKFNEVVNDLIEINNEKTV